MKEAKKIIYLINKIKNKMENPQREGDYIHIEKQLPYLKPNDTTLTNNTTKEKEKVTEMVSVSTTPDNEASLTEGFTEIVISDTKESPDNKDKHKDNMFSSLSILPCRKGNMCMFWYDKNLCPRIVIGPHCKYILFLIHFKSRAFNFMFFFFRYWTFFIFLYWFME